jgi:hypothetical protein
MKLAVQLLFPQDLANQPTPRCTIMTIAETPEEPSPSLAPTITASLPESRRSTSKTAPIPERGPDDILIMVMSTGMWATILC